MGSPTVFPAGFIDLSVSITGEILNKSIIVDEIRLSTSINGSGAIGHVIATLPIQFTVNIEAGYTSLTQLKDNWIKWSKIGSLDFTIDQSNIAGERILDWKGLVFQILKLGTKAFVVYGLNGVTMFSPATIHSPNLGGAMAGMAGTQVTPTFAMQNLSPVGVLWKGAIAGNDEVHFFIDERDRLCLVSSEGIKILDYSEYLEQMTNPVLTFEDGTGLLYICDGTLGYIYSSRFNSFGEGPATITGSGIQSGVGYVTAPEEFEIPPFEITTDIYDFGIRKPKTIQWIELGVNANARLEVMIETRVSKSDEFKKTPWKLVNPSGVAHCPCYGSEFKFHVRSETYEWFTLDYIKVHGTVHALQPFLEDVK